MQAGIGAYELFFPSVSGCRMLVAYILPHHFLPYSSGKPEINHLHVETIRLWLTLVLAYFLIFILILKLTEVLYVSSNHKLHVYFFSRMLQNNLYSELLVFAQTTDYILENIHTF